jgi:hypothetical protein
MRSRQIAGSLKNPGEEAICPARRMQILGLRRQFPADRLKTAGGGSDNDNVTVIHSDTGPSSLRMAVTPKMATPDKTFFIYGLAFCSPVFALLEVG